MKTVDIFDNESFLMNVPYPIRTDSYTPISHEAIINKVKEELDKNSLILASSSYNSARNGRVVVGNYNISAGNPDYMMRIMFKNSYDKSVSFGMASGLSIICCTNGSVSGEYSLKRKHTGIADKDVDGYIEEAIKGIGDYYERLVADMTLLRDISLTEKEASHITGELYLLGDVINGMQLNIVKDELYNSKNFVHIDSELFSAFDWYQSITESLKKSHPTRFISDHAELHQFVKNRFL